MKFWVFGMPHQRSQCTPSLNRKTKQVAIVNLHPCILKSRKRKNSSSNSKVKSLSEPSVKSKILKVLGAIDINKPGFECRLCSKTFAKPALLKSHQRYIHAKNSKVKKYHPNLFNITDKTLKDTEKYRSAPKGHFQCPHCSDVFEVERSLEVHIGRKHNAKSNIPCPENCGKYLTCKSAIAKHLLSHRPREQWPYKCKIKTFISWKML